MMSGMALETRWAFNEQWNNKFYYKVASCWLFLFSFTCVFSNTFYDSMCAALAKHGVNYTIRQWIRATPEGRLATVTLGGLSRSIRVSRGCPQGGVLSPLLWCLVVDEMLAGLSGVGVYTQGYVNDNCLLVVGKFPNMVSGLIQWALHSVLPTVFLSMKNPKPNAIKCIMS